MRDLYYGDRRDRVKWGALAHLAERAAKAEHVLVAELQQFWKLLNAGEVGA